MYILSNEEPVSEVTEELDPILQFCVFCDSVTPASDKKHVFSGVFDLIMRPIVVPQFFIALRWINGRGSHTSKLRILDPDLKAVFETEEIPFKLPHRVHPHDAVFQLSNFHFSMKGVYWVEILLNGESHTSIPLPVRESPGKSLRTAA
ncbi:MAG: hypothetical protein ACE5OZ_02100 [Candidatus Heimdallarchaeota archaeon]